MPVFSGRTIHKTRLYIMMAGILCFFLDITEIRTGMIGLGIVAVVVCLVLNWQEKNITKQCIWIFEKEGIRRSFLGLEDYVSYREIHEALQSKKVKITATAFKLPRKRGYITFHYEVGNDKVQKVILESYEFLMKEINVEIPRFSLKVIRQMDRSFYFKRDRRNCVIFMLLSAIPMIFVGKENSLAGFLFAALGQLVQYTMLGYLFKGIYFGKKVEKRISNMFAPYKNAELRKVKVSYMLLVPAVLLAAAANLCFLYVGWRRV